MSVGEALDNLLLQPLILLCDVIYSSLAASLGFGWALILLGVVVNLVLLPLYYGMERTGREARLARAAMEREIAVYRAHYKGRELYFYTRTVHRHYGHHPLKALFTSSDLFLQVIVFSTVYRYLSGLSGLQGVSFLGIPDLSRPDGLLGGVHLLPLLMTAANLASVFAYADDPAKRRQGPVLALLFLALLYSSPSGLVVYWTSNNVFSLLRNLIGRKLGPRLPSTWRSGLARLATQE